MQYTNYYVHCQQVWSDVWDCMCNDKCPVCNKEIEPFMSDEIPPATEDAGRIMHVSDDFIPEQGLPNEVDDLEGLILLAELTRP